MIKKLILIFFMFILMISMVYSSSLVVTGELYEYDKKYFEEVYVNIDCNTTSKKITFPKNSKNIRDMRLNKIIKDKSLILNGCNEYDFFYELPIIEFPKSKVFRIERNFNSYENFNFFYEIKVSNELIFQLNQSQPNNKEIKIDYFNTYKLYKFPQNKFYLLYFEKFEKKHKISLNSFIHEYEETEVIIITILSLLLGIGIATIYFKKKEGQIIETTVPSYVLEKDEKLILDIVKLEPGINQKQIGGKLDFTKSKVSSIVNILEQKQLLKREKFGRSFKVFLNKKIQ